MSDELKFTATDVTRNIRPKPHTPSQPVSAGRPQPGSWHWKRPDPLGGLYSRFPFKLLIHDHVGLDVGSTWLKYAVTRHGAGHPRLLSAGGVPILSQGGGQMGKLRAQVAALLAVRNRVPRQTERWIVGLSGQGTIVRTVELPHMPRREMRKAVLWQAQKKIPFPLDEAHVAISYLKTAPNQPVRAVVSAAVKRIVDDLLYLLAEAEIKPSAVTLPAFGLGRILGMGGFGQPGECHGLLDIGAQRTLFAVYRGEQLEFYREIELGIGDVEEALANDLRQGGTDAERPHTQAGDLLFDMGLGPGTGDTSAGPLMPSIQDALERLLLEIQNTLEYFAAQSGGVRINKFMLLGGGAEIPGIEAHLSHFLEMPVELLDPLQRGPDAAYQSDPGLLKPARWASAYGYSVLPRRVANMLPPDYVREEDSEFRSLLWRTATGTAVAVSMMLTGAEYYRGGLATHRADDLAVRLGETSARLDALGGPHTEVTLAANRRWLSALARKDLRSADLLRWLSSVTPTDVALDILEAKPTDSGWTEMGLSGEVRSPHDQDEVVLAQYVDRLSRTGYFDHVSLEQFSTLRKADYEQLQFHITLRTPLLDRRP